MFDIENTLKAAGLAESIRGPVASLLEKHHPANIATGPECATALRMLGAYLSTTAEKVDFQASAQRAQIGAGLVAIRNRRAHPTSREPARVRTEQQARASQAAALREVIEASADLECIRCGATESAFFAETDGGAQLCETCYNMGDCEPIEGENPKVNISDLCAIPPNFKRDRTMTTADRRKAGKPENKQAPSKPRNKKGPEGGSAARLSPPPATGPEGPNSAGLSLLEQARALSQA